MFDVLGELESGNEFGPGSTHFPSLLFEDSVTGKPNTVQCRANLPGDIYLSAQLSAAKQAKLVR